MKFSVMRDEIFNALQRVVSVIPQRSTFMMTQNILLFTETEATGSSKQMARQWEI